MNYLITGGCGFLGSNLATEVLGRNEELIIFDNLYRVGSYKNLEWLKTKGNFKFVHGDIRNRENLLESMLVIKLKYKKLPPRGSDQKVFVADITKAEKLINWKPKVSKEEGLRKMIEWINDI